MSPPRMGLNGIGEVLQKPCDNFLHVSCTYPIKAPGSAGGYLLLIRNLGSRQGRKGSAEGLSLQVEAIAVMDQPIEDGIGQGWVT